MKKHIVQRLHLWYYYAGDKMFETLYEDNHIIAVNKPVGMLSEDSDSPESLPSEIKKAKGITLYTLHRLDKPVGGVIIYAKTKKAAASFSGLIAENKLTKTYLAVVNGTFEEKEGRMEDLLFKDSRKNKTFVVNRMRKGVKTASLKYRILDSVEYLSLAEIELETGRSHQIRVQFASRKHPLCGDGKYGSRDNKCNVALFSHKVEFIHPETKEKLCITALPDYNDYPWSLFRTENEM